LRQEFVNLKKRTLTVAKEEFVDFLKWTLTVAKKEHGNWIGHQKPTPIIWNGTSLKKKIIAINYVESSNTILHQAEAFYAPRISIMPKTKQTNK
jgi:hypothetical protein